MSTKEMEKEARALCNHTIVYTDPESKRIAMMALKGKTTKRIAMALGVTESTAQYRIQKAQRRLGVRFREAYRSGGHTSRKLERMLDRMDRVSDRIAQRFVETQIAPQFIPFARQGVGRLA